MLWRGNGAGVALGGLLPPGRFPTSFLERFPGVGDHDGWPTGLWIPALRADDGLVTVFGRDRTDVSGSDAVEASSAVPGIFRPKVVDGHRYMDGGLASPTHADLPAGSDLVIISSPMTKRSGRPMSRLARRRLAKEISELSGSRVVLVEPPDEMAEIARGFPRHNSGAAAAIIDLAEEATRNAIGAERAAA
jgi:predicted acylesterase/phospholipase RssA